MFGLTGAPLLVLTSVVAVAALAGVVWLAVRPARDGTPRRRLVLRAVPAALLVLVAQVCAVGAVLMSINDSYGFYTSWADLGGKTVGKTPITTGGLAGPGQGRLEVFTVHHHKVGRDDRMLVWLPPQYDEAAYRSHRLPVLMFLPGQPSTPQALFRHFDFAAVATHAIATHRVPPFIAVFPTMMIDPPRDTECTNIPGGPRAETWLVHDVPAFVTAHVRAAPLGRDWATMGWSTGGFCASKLVAAHPDYFGSAVAMGAYFQPLQDHTTGDLFDGRHLLEVHNSPLWLYLHRNGLGHSRLLIVSGRQDKESWASSEEMLSATARDPAVSHIIFPVGGHNFHNYSAYLPASLQWSAKSWTT